MTPLAVEGIQANKFWFAKTPVQPALTTSWALKRLYWLVLAKELPIWAPEGMMKER